MNAVAAPAPAEMLQHERLLWGLCYRMTGSAADADDLVQDTFVRALERPPARDGDVRPWLVKVALNLAKDRLRARKRREYKGEWLPAPVPTSASLDEPASFEPAHDGGPMSLLDDAASPFRRYELIESVSMAFLLALEALTPRQRAVVLLCDVFEYGGEQAAEALGISAGNVKVSRHRARKALAAYDAARAPTAKGLADRTRDALQAFVAALATGDAATARALLADDAIGLNDGGGDYSAAKIPLVGATRITQAFAGFVKHGSPVLAAVWTTLNGLPALVIDLAPARAQLAPRVVIQAELDATGRIRRLYTVVAKEKLCAVAAAPVA